MTKMKDKLNDAGIDTARARLAELVKKANERFGNNRTLAFTRLRKTVCGDAELLLALVGPEIADAKLNALMTEVQRGSGGGQCRFESQESHDRPAPTPSNGSRGSHCRVESQEEPDPSVTSSTRGGVSQASLESQRRIDRPAAPSRGGVSQDPRESQSDTDRPSPPSTKISKAAAETVARQSIYDLHIGFDITLRNADLITIINSERRGSKYTRYMTLLRTSKRWPKGAKVPDVYSERELRSLLVEAEKAIPPLPLEAHNV